MLQHLQHLAVRKPMDDSADRTSTALLQAHLGNPKPWPAFSAAVGTVFQYLRVHFKKMDQVKNAHLIFSTFINLQWKWVLQEQFTHYCSWEEDEVLSQALKHQLIGELINRRKMTCQEREEGE